MTDSDQVKYIGFIALFFSSTAQTVGRQNRADTDGVLSEWLHSCKQHTRMGAPVLLPIRAHADRILEAVRAHPVTVVIGETGSGKTTQISQVRTSLRCVLAHV